MYIIFRESAMELCAFSGEAFGQEVLIIHDKKVPFTAQILKTFREMLY